MPVVPIPRPAPVAGVLPVAGGIAAGRAAIAAAAALKVLQLLHPRPAPRPPIVTDPEVQTLEEMIQDFYDGARIPVGSPMPPPLPDPAPMAGVVWGGLLGTLQRLADWWIPSGSPGDWGGINSRPGSVGPLPAGVGAWPTGTWDPSGANIWGFTATGTYGAPGPQQGEPRTWSGTFAAAAGERFWIEPVGGGPLGDGGVVLSNDWNIRKGPEIGGAGSVVHEFARVGNWYKGFTVTATVAPVTPGPGVVPFGQLGGGAPDGWAPVATFPAVGAPAPATAPVPRPRPVTVPALPQVAPLAVPGPSRPATAPAPATVPAARPAILPLPAPAPANGITITRGGTLPATAPPAAATTAAGTKVLSRGGSAVQVVPVSVPATLAGIAQELGRVERKLQLQLERPDPPAFDPEALLEDLRGLLEELLGQQGQTDPEGSYLLSSPCEKDEQGNPLPATAVEFPASPVGLPAVLKRLDALAALLQVHKTLKQPSCKHPRPQGDLVTVTFEQI